MAFLLYPVNSSNVEAIGWEANKLYVRFLNGGDYVYSNVPKAIFDAMYASSSKGHFLATQIKGKYPFRPTTINAEYAE